MVAASASSPFSSRRFLPDSPQHMSDRDATRDHRGCQGANSGGRGGGNGGHMNINLNANDSYLYFRHAIMSMQISKVWLQRCMGGGSGRLCKCRTGRKPAGCPGKCRVKSGASMASARSVSAHARDCAAARRRRGRTGCSALRCHRGFSCLRFACCTIMRAERSPGTVARCAHEPRGRPAP